MDEGFRPTIKAIKKWDPQVRKQLRSDLKGVGNSIASGARTVASAHSKTIPGTIKVRTRIQSRKAEVEIIAGSAEVPIAGLFELGNKGGGSAAKGRKFRHPIFGDWDVQFTGKDPREQDMHPYLAPVVKLRQNYATRVIGEAVEKANTEVFL